MMKRKHLTALIAAACVTQAYAAETLAPITVSADRDNQILTNTAAADAPVSVIGQKSLQQQSATTLRDALQMTPGVSMDGQGRYGAQDITIHGVSGNRVGLTLDGVPIANSFSFGPYQKAGRNYFDTSDIKQIDITRGAVDPKNGAIGGTVGMTTTNPNDILQPKATFGGEVGLGFTGKDDGKRLDGKAAFRNENVSGIVNYAFTDHHETKNEGGKNIIGRGRTAANPQRGKINNLSAKILYTPNENHTFTFNGSVFHDEQSSDLLDGLGKSLMPSKTAPKGLEVFNRVKYNSKDASSRQALSISDDFALNDTDNGMWRVYAQQHESNQKTSYDQNILNLPNMPLKKVRMDNHYRTRDIGLTANFDNTLKGDFLQQKLSYGVDYSFHHYEMKQHEVVTINDKQTSDKTNKFGPDTTVNKLGIFAQDSLTLGQTGLTITPGLRYDYYGLNPKDSPLYRNSDGVGNYAHLRKYNLHHVSPHLGLSYQIGDNTLFANYNEAFRAPTYQETNFAFANYDLGYSLVTNPDLKPETSRGFELGWQMKNDHWNGGLTAYYNRYKDYIFLDIPNTKFNPQRGLLEFKYNNLPKAEIYGVEWASNFDMGNGVSVQTALAYTKGKNGKGKPISSIDPFNGSWAVSYDAPEKEWGVSTMFRASAAKRAKDTANGKDSAGGYGVLDVTGYYSPVKNLTIRTGVYNVFDKKYAPWSDAQLSTKGYDAATNPGRWFGASVRYDF